MEKQIIIDEINKISRCIPLLGERELYIIKESLESCYGSGYCKGYTMCKYDMKYDMKFEIFY